MTVKLFDQNSMGALTTRRSDYAAALNHVVTSIRTRQTVAAVNMSLGSGFNTSACDNQTGDSGLVRSAVGTLSSYNIPTVASSGNAAQDTDGDGTPDAPWIDTDNNGWVDTGYQDGSGSPPACRA